MTASGGNHSLFLDELGSVWGCGFNQHGQLGLGDATSRLRPEKININLPIVSISAGYDHSLFLDSDGSVWACGANSYGQLGMDDTVTRNTAEKLPFLAKITAVLAISQSSFFLDEEGFVWSCGSNTHGQLGLGGQMSRYKPCKVPGLPKIKSIAGGAIHVLFLDEEGSVWGCGYNQSGELGHAISKRTPAKVEGLPTIVAVAGGYRHSLFLDNEGCAWACGSNGSGELGLGHNQPSGPEKITHISDIISVAAGFCSSMFLDKEGTVFCCGHNSNGQLGLVDKSNKLYPQKVTNIPPVLFLSTSAVAKRYQIVDIEGSVWSSGLNQYGQLGVGDCRKRHEFEKVLTLPKLKVHLGIHRNVALEKALFHSLIFQQSKQLKNMIISTIPTSNYALPAHQIKDRILSGVIPMANWSSKWIPIHKRNEHLSQSITEVKTVLSEKQQQLLKLQQETAEMQQQLDDLEEEKDALQFFDAFLGPISEIETELRCEFVEKVRAGKNKEFTMDDVSLFLNVCGMEGLVEQQRDKKWTGEALELASSDISVCGIKQPLEEKKLMFYLKLLQSRKLLNEDELGKSVIWANRDVEKTLELLREWQICVDEELVRKKEISICQLIFFKQQDLEELLNVRGSEGMKMLGNLETLKNEFELFLKL